MRIKEGEIMSMYQCVCGEWVSSTENHQCKPYPSNVIMTDEDKEKIKTSFDKAVEQNDDALKRMDD